MEYFGRIDRTEYLKGLAESNGLPFAYVAAVDESLGATEDDSLIMLLDEMSMNEDIAAEIWAEYDPENSPF